MIICFKLDSETGISNPVVVVDYTRTDDQWSFAEIQEQVANAGVELLGGSFNPVTPSNVYSLDYSMSFRHSGVNLGDALKTSVKITVSNAPAEMIALMNIQQLVGSESALSLENAVAKVVDPQNQFPVGLFIFKYTDVAGYEQKLSRKFTVYGTTFNFDARRISSRLEIRAASFDSVVMRLALAVNMDKKLPIAGQITSALSSTTLRDFQVSFDPVSLGTLPPVLDRYYPPATLNKVLADFCQDNGLFFDIDETAKKVVFKSASSANPPTVSDLPSTLCFRNRVPASALIATFSVSDYATATIGSEILDVNLFDPVDVYDDSDAKDLFSNFRKNGLPYKTIDGYRFFVMEYQYTFSAHTSALTIRGTNNWLVSNFKLDTIFEPAVYKGLAQ